MKVKKIKSRHIYLNTCYALCFVALGWYLNNRFSPAGNSWIGYCKRFGYSFAVTPNNGLSKT